MLRKICAWCKRPLNDEPDDGSLISHGLCPRCREYLQHDRKSIYSFLSTIDAPVLAVDGASRMISANRPDLLSLNGEHSDIAEKLGGEVIECIYYLLPNGCGKAIHCTGCQIRMCVNQTRATGKPFPRTKAYHHAMTPAGVKTSHYYISAETSVDSRVLLRIEEAREFRD